MIRVQGIVGFVLATPVVALASDAGAEHPGAGMAPWLITGALLAAVALLGGRQLLRRTRGHHLGAGAADHSGHSQLDPVLPRQYSPQNVGNDASARPWESMAAVEPVVGAGLAPSGPAVPDGFDVEAFLCDSKAHFIGLQAAWDRGDVPALRAMMTEGMLAEIQWQLAERERTGGAAEMRSEVVMIDAQLLGIEEVDNGYMASVEFSGLMRESLDAGPNPFRELWNITRPKGGEGRWLVAGVQALH